MVFSILAGHPGNQVGVPNYSFKNLASFLMQTSFWVNKRTAERVSKIQELVTLSPKTSGKLEIAFQRAAFLLQALICSSMVFSQIFPQKKREFLLLLRRVPSLASAFEGHRACLVRGEGFHNRTVDARKTTRNRRRFFNLLLISFLMTTMLLRFLRLRLLRKLRMIKSSQPNQILGPVVRMPINLIQD